MQLVVKKVKFRTSDFFPGPARFIEESFHPRTNFVAPTCLHVILLILLRFAHSLTAYLDSIGFMLRDRIIMTKFIPTHRGRGLEGGYNHPLFKLGAKVSFSPPPQILVKINLVFV